MRGVIIKGIGGFYYVSVEGQIYCCSARGRLRYDKIKPMVGDMVEIKVQSAETFEGVIEKILDRRNQFVRPPVANIDQIAVVLAAAQPEPDFFVIDKLLVQAEHEGIDVIICANKTDIADADYIAKVYESAGYKTILLCARDGGGIDNLRRQLGGKTTAFAGNSGVGKSSILNALGLELEVGEVSKIERGKHTTRHSELFSIGDNGLVIDTPGFSLLDVVDVKAESLGDYFREFDGLPPCEFKDCAHVNCGGCSVIDAVERGEIAGTRYDSYVQLYDILKKKKKWE